MSKDKRSLERIDLLLTQRGLAPSREQARALIMAGEVRVNGQPVAKAGTLVPRDAVCELSPSGAGLRFVSRGGLKLERALDAFALDPTGLVCLDVGASTGGFTDLLLQRGARRVYAVDVGHGQLAWSLRTNERVVVMEGANIRLLTSLPEPIDCAVIDVSFISLRLVLPAVARLLTPQAWVVALVKPQFEAGRAEADRGAGVIRDPTTHRRILRDLLTWLATPPTPLEIEVARSPGDPQAAQRLVARRLIPSPITGREGNHEYLLLMAVSTAGEQHATREPFVTEGMTTASEQVGDAEIEQAISDAFGDTPTAKRVQENQDPRRLRASEQDRGEA
ncbi:MAG TPA: TlyA family RNA methyltransferase [Ktedonobacterales bacterium]|nr:TlyA family RNA methyltransferase [Ktedonobacterales bacterium]